MAKPKSSIEKFINSYLRNKKISESKEGYEAWLRKNGIDPTATLSDSIGKTYAQNAIDSSELSSSAQSLYNSGLSKSGYAKYLGEALEKSKEDSLGKAIHSYLKTDSDNKIGYDSELQRRESARIAAEEKAEKERIKAEQKAQAERLKAEAKAEAERIKAEEKAKKEAEKAAEKAAKEEAERLKAEQKAEAERLKAEAKAEAERIKAEEKAKKEAEQEAEKAAKEEAKRLEQEAKAEAERLAAEEKAKQEKIKAEEKAREEAKKAAEKLASQAAKEESAAMKSYQKVKEQLIKNTESDLKELGIINYDEAYEYALKAGLDETNATSIAKSVTDVARNAAMTKVTNTIISKYLTMNQAKEYALALGLSEEDAQRLGEFAFRTNESVGDIVSQKSYLEYLQEIANQNN